MTAAATSEFRPFRSILWTVPAGIVAAALWLSWPSPTPSPLLPQMAEHPVILPDSTQLHVQKFEVTIAEWNLCHMAGHCALSLRARADQSALTTPATGLSHADIRQYITWINAETGLHFRLPTLDEWAYMARDVLPEEPDPIFTDPALSWASDYLIEGLPDRTLKPTGSHTITQEGVADLDGSVWEWTSDCFNDAPEGRCAAFYVGGEHVAAMSYLIRDPARGGCAVGAPPAHLGFRLVSDLPIH